MRYLMQMTQHLIMKGFLEGYPLPLNFLVHNMFYALVVCLFNSQCYIISYINNLDLIPRYETISCCSLLFLELLYFVSSSLKGIKKKKKKRFYCCKACHLIQARYLLLSVTSYVVLSAAHFLSAWLCKSISALFRFIKGRFYFALGTLAATSNWMHFLLRKTVATSHSLFFYLQSF